MSSTNTNEYAAARESRRFLDAGPARLLSFLAASLFCLSIVVFPQLVIDQGQPPNHGVLVLGLWGMAAGFVHGVGFIPHQSLLRLALGPLAAWVLLALGSALLFNF